MTKYFFQLALLVSSLTSYSQKLDKLDDKDEILHEARLLYRAEKASWHSTDHFLANLGSKIDLVRGYLSYVALDGNTYSIFYTENEKGDRAIVARYQYGNPVTQNFSSLDTLDTRVSPHENKLIDLRVKTFELISENPDDFFQFYENTAFNVIPIVNDVQFNVYVLTGPKVNGQVLLGNDYFLTFNSKMKLKKMKKLHNSLIQIPYQGEYTKIKDTYHSHVVTDQITATDICTLLLYRDYVEWDTHIVIGKKFTSIFDIRRENLVIMKTEAFRKIGKNSN